MKIKGKTESSSDGSRNTSVTEVVMAAA